MKRQKTIQVVDLVKFFNKKNEQAESIAERELLNSLLEGFLFTTGNYRGYSYTEWTKGGYDRWLKAGCPDFPEKSKYLGDPTRRQYFIAEGLEDRRRFPANYKSKITSADHQLPALKKKSRKK